MAVLRSVADGVTPAFRNSLSTNCVGDKVVGNAIEEVVIVLSYESLRIVYDVRGRLDRVVVDVNGDRRGRAKVDARGITKGDVESLSPFDERIVVDQHLETLRGLARCKAQGAPGSDVIAALSGGAI